jgi:prevent-host-death family protein
MIGIRELKTRLGTYLRLVQNGERIVVTDRGRPVAELRSIAGTEDEDVRLAELAAFGLVSPGSGAALLPFEPVPVSGAPVSETLLEDRADRI